MSDVREALEELEGLMGTDGWKALVRHFQQQQLSLSRQLVAAEDIDFVEYHKLAAEHRSIGKVITWPGTVAEQLRNRLEAEAQTE